MSGAAGVTWTRQVEELRRVRALEPWPDPGPPSATLLAPAPGARCLVCGAPDAAPCAGCGAVAYCGEEHRADDESWHRPACARLATAAADERELAGGAARGAADHVAERLRAGSTPDGWPSLLGEDPRADVQARLATRVGTRPLTLLAALRALPRAEGRLRVLMAGAGPEEASVTPTLWDAVAEALGRDLELRLVGPALEPRIASCRRVTLLFERRLAVPRDLERPLELLVAFQPGFLLYPTWRPLLSAWLRSSVPLLFTSQRTFEQTAELQVLTGLGARDLPLLPAENPWASCSWRRSSTLANDATRDGSLQALLAAPGARAG